MELSKTMKGLHSYKSLEGKTELCFELFNWLKGKEISARQALDLLSLTGEAIREARKAEIDKIVL